MDRAAIANGPENPIVAACGYPDLPSLLRLRGPVYALPKLLEAFERAFDGKSQRARGVAMPACPASLTGIGLDEIGQRQPQLDVLIAERQQLVTRPWQLMQIHVARLDNRAV